MNYTMYVERVFRQGSNKAMFNALLWTKKIIWFEEDLTNGNVNYPSGLLTTQESVQENPNMEICL